MVSLTRKNLCVNQKSKLKEILLSERFLLTNVRLILACSSSIRTRLFHCQRQSNLVLRVILHRRTLTLIRRLSYCPAPRFPCDPQSSILEEPLHWRVKLSEYPVMCALYKFFASYPPGGGGGYITCGWDGRGFAALFSEGFLLIAESCRKTLFYDEF